MYTGNSSVYIIVGAVIGVIIVLSLLFIVAICYFMRRKGMYVCICMCVVVNMYGTYNFKYTLDQKLKYAWDCKNVH